MCYTYGVLGLPISAHFTSNTYQLALFWRLQCRLVDTISLQRFTLQFDCEVKGINDLFAKWTIERERERERKYANVPVGKWWRVDEKRTFYWLLTPILVVHQAIMSGGAHTVHSIVGPFTKHHTDHGFKCDTHSTCPVPLIMTRKRDPIPDLLSQWHTMLWHFNSDSLVCRTSTPMCLSQTNKIQVRFASFISNRCQGWFPLILILLSFFLFFPGSV